MPNNKITNFFVELGRGFRLDLFIFFKDKALYPSVLMTSLFVAWLYTCIYGREIVEKVPVAIVDQDNTPLSRQLYSMIGGTQQVQLASIGSSFDEAKNAFHHGNVYGIIVIPKDFAKDISLGRSAHVSSFADGALLMMYKQISTAVAGAVGTLNAQIEVGGAMKSGLNYQNSVGSRRSITAISNPMYNPYGGYATFVMPCVYVLIIQVLVLTTIGILGGTMVEFGKYFLVYKIRDGSYSNILPILLGRALFYTSVCVIVFTIICGMDFTIFKLPFRGRYLDCVVYLLPTFFSICFLGFALMGIFKKREDACVTISFSSIPAIFLTGMSWPVQMFPFWVKALAYLLPSTLGIRGFVSLSQFGASFNEVKGLWIQSWWTAIFYFLLAYLVNLKFIQTRKLN